MNKKVLAFLIIIVVAIVLLVFGRNTTEDAQLPTRDVEGLEPITTVEEYCSKLRDIQEFDDSVLAQEYYQDCLAQNK